MRTVNPSTMTIGLAFAFGFIGVTFSWINRAVAEFFGQTITMFQGAMFFVGLEVMFLLFLISHQLWVLIFDMRKHGDSEDRSPPRLRQV